MANLPVLVVALIATVIAVFALYLLLWPIFIHGILIEILKELKKRG